ncbi:MAG: transposase, partial [Peptococcaceae bacterium BICA1-8]
HLFQERYKSEVVEDENYFLTVLRYIHQNPVKAGLTNHAGGYKWSSYKDYIEGTSLVNIDFALNILSSKRENAIKEYVQFMNRENEDKCLEYEERLRVNDDDIKLHFARLGVVNISDLHQLERSQRNQLIKVMKSMEGVTIRQLSRITGIGKSVIDRI